MRRVDDFLIAVIHFGLRVKKVKTYMGAEQQNRTHNKRINSIEKMLLMYSQNIQLSTNIKAFRQVIMREKKLFWLGAECVLS